MWALWQEADDELQEKDEKIAQLEKELLEQSVLNQSVNQSALNTSTAPVPDVGKLQAQLERERRERQAVMSIIRAIGKHDQVLQLEECENAVQEK